MTSSLEIDKIIHQPVRTKIMMYLASVGEVDYTTLKKQLDLTDGHMSTHIKALVTAGYIEFTKTFVENKPKTTYQMTESGKQAFKSYIEMLRKIIDI